MTKPRTYHFIVCGWNCEPYAAECLDSILAQRLPHGARLRIVVVNDGSEDATTRILLPYNERREVRVFTLRPNRGAAYSRFLAMQWAGAKPEDVFVFLDLDDYLAHRAALKAVHASYEAGAEVTYCSAFVAADGRYFAPETYETHEDVRRQRFMAWPLRTCLARLALDIPAQDFKMEGEWLRKNTDVALMLGVMERADPAAIARIDDVLYVYHDRPDGARIRHGRAYQERVKRHLQPDLYGVTA